VAEASISELCAFGDSLIEAEVKKVFTKDKKMEKGVAFPTCLSVNNVVGHYSPLKSEDAQLKAGDLVKIDLGCHIDGFVGLVAHTAVVGGAKAEGRKADVVLAAYNAIQASLRLLKPGNLNYQVTDVVAKSCEAFKCSAVEGVLSHQVNKFFLDGNACIINKETFEQKVEDYEFKVNDVFVLDVIVSTGAGQPKESELRTTVYKRDINRNYVLKSKAARTFFNDVLTKYPVLCFSQRSFEDEITAKIGVKECLEHELLNAYPVLLEKSDELVAHFKYTVLMTSASTLQTTGLTLPTENFITENKIQDEHVLKLI